MADEYWKSTPFGKGSFFHPEWDDKQKDARQNYEAAKITDLFVDKDIPSRFLPFLPKSSPNSPYVAITVMVKVIVEGFADKVEVSVDDNYKRTASKLSGTKIFQTLFSLSIPKTLARIDQYGTKEFVFKANVTDLFLKKITDSRSVKVKIDTQGKILTSTDIAIIVKKECFCKKNIWSADDLKYVVSELRKKQDILSQTQYDEVTKNPLFIDKDGNILKSNDRGKSPKEGAVKYKKETSFYDRNASDNIPVGDRLFYLKSTENILDNERNYTVLSQWINYLFKEIKATKCINKIHILSQIYHETQRLGSTYESDSSAKKSGEDFFRGRGLIMITKKNNYKTFYKFLFGQDPTENELKDFVPKLASSTEMAAKSAAWYLNALNIQKYFNEDNVNNVSAAINYPKALETKNYSSINGLDERQHYFELFKEVLNYDECK